jgi:hypothetical protein
MNTTSGESSAKQHLTNGSKTACNRKSSGHNKNEFESFKWWMDNAPHLCCQKCSNRFIEKLNNLKSKK